MAGFMAFLTLLRCVKGHISSFVPDTNKMGVEESSFRTASRTSLELKAEIRGYPEENEQERKKEKRRENERSEWQIEQAEFKEEKI
jgi:hypothetical protein